MIYFIQAEDGAGPIKIGTASNVARRLSGLQTASPNHLRVLGVADGGKVEEKAIQARFRNARIRGEWFEPTDELREFIDRETAPWEIGLPPDVHRLLRLVAADENMSIVSFVRKALRKRLLDEANKLEIRA